MINTLPLRLNVDETPVETAVRHAHARLSALLAHEHATLVLAQRCSGVPVDLPLFSALLNYRRTQHSDQSTEASPGVIFIGEEGRINYPLVMSVDDNETELCLSFVVAEAVSANRICCYMQQTLESLADALTHTQQQPVRMLAVIPSEERTLLLHTWNQTTVTYLPDRCLHQLFEAQVRHNGPAISVESNGEFVSYFELNQQSNRVAHYLIARGVRPDDRIALCMERCNTLIVAMLGILKAGGAYVPLDSVYSSKRLTHILEDADPKFLLADSTGRRALKDHQVPVIDSDQLLLDDLSFENPSSVHFGPS